MRFGGTLPLLILLIPALASCHFTGDKGELNDYGDGDRDGGVVLPDDDPINLGDRDEEAYELDSDGLMDGDGTDGDLLDGDEESDKDDYEPSDGDASDGDVPDGDEDGLTGDILPCEPRDGAENVLLIQGTVVTPDEAWLNGEVLVDRQQHIILCAAPDCSSHANYAEATHICAEGIVMPGMLDPHNHAGYNTIPRWKHPGDAQCRSCNPSSDPACPPEGQKCLRKDGLYRHRYSWSDDPDYDRTLKVHYNGLKDDHHCAMQKWAELRMLAHGTTGVAGSYQMSRCHYILARNLDQATTGSGLARDAMRTNISAVADIIKDDALVADYCSEFAAGDTTALLLHVAEGVVEADAKEEFWRLAEPDPAHPEMTLMAGEIVNIHSTAGYTDELALLSCAGAKLVWSPRSNVDLYGQTANIPVAMNMGVSIALGPDWTPSGSLSLLQEMQCAKSISDRYWDGAVSDENLVRFSTLGAAEVMAIEEQIGSLETGKLADVAVIAADEDGRRHPYRTIVAAEAWDVRLTLVGGEPLYGDRGVAPFGPFCEDLDVCGHAKTICAKQSDSAADGYNQRLGDIRAELETALAPLRDAAASTDKYIFDLFPLFFCPGTEEYDADRPEAVCTFHHNPHYDVVHAAVPAEAVADDRDTDGVADADDNCPRVNNADQLDKDSDGTGDACQPISLGPADCPRRPSIGCQVEGARRLILPPPDSPPQDDRPLRTVRELTAPGGNLTLPFGDRVMLSALFVTVVEPSGFYAQDDGSRPYGGMWIEAPNLIGRVRTGEWIDIWGTIEFAAGQWSIHASHVRSTDLCSISRPDPPKPAQLSPGSDLSVFLGMRVQMVRDRKAAGVVIHRRLTPDTFEILQAD
ncbi:MAG: hypothetical protein C4523_12385 [Myxococcales bacterium]|nr:MAG: hypothetical protein C4523_12385 [Myxococcales bacterium]